MGSAAYVAHVRKNKSYCFWNRVYLDGPPVTLVRQSDKKFNDVIALSKHGQSHVSASRRAHVCTQGTQRERCTRRCRCTRVDRRVSLHTVYTKKKGKKKNKMAKDKVRAGYGNGRGLRKSEMRGIFTIPLTKLHPFVR